MLLTIMALKPIKIHRNIFLLKQEHEKQSNVNFLVTKSSNAPTIITMESQTTPQITVVRTLATVSGNTFPKWLQNRLISAGLEPVLSHTENMYFIVLYSVFINIKLYNQNINTGFVIPCFRNL